MPSFALAICSLFIVSTIQIAMNVVYSKNSSVSAIIYEMLIIALFALIYAFGNKKQATIGYVVKFSLTYSFFSFLFFFWRLYNPFIATNMYEAFGGSYTFFAFIVYFPCLLLINFTYPAIIFSLSNRLSIFIINNPAILDIKEIPNNIRKYKKPLSVILIIMAILITYNSTEHEGFKKLSDMNFSRSHYSAILLNDGRVFVADETPEIYDSATKKFSITKQMNIPKTNIELNLLKDGNVFIFGHSIKKNYSCFYCPASAEIFNPKTNEYKLINNFKDYRSEYKSLVLQNGSILIPGSFDYKKKTYLKGMLFSPATNKIKSINSMSFDNYDLVQLNNGKVFILGRMNDTYSGGIYSIQIYDPITNNVEVKPSNFKGVMTQYAPHLILLNDGRVFIYTNNSVGGNSFYVYDTNKEKLVRLERCGNKFFGNYTATQLKNGKILITGGKQIQSSTLKQAGICDPVSDTYIQISNMTTKREGHNATLLKDGTVLITGGYSNNEKLKSAELFIPSKRH